MMSRRGSLGRRREDWEELPSDIIRLRLPKLLHLPPPSAARSTSPLVGCDLGVSTRALVTRHLGRGESATHWKKVGIYSVELGKQQDWMCLHTHGANSGS